MSTLLIKEGRVIDPLSGFDATADVLIHADRIEAIGVGLPAPAGAQVIDARDCLVTPGFIDPHVHLREPGHEYKETIATGSAAAVSGGFSTVCCMPNTAPALDSPELVRFVYDRALHTARCRVYPVAAVTRGRKGEELTEIQLLSEAGAVAYSDDGDCVASAGMMSRVFQAVAATGKVFMQHCQEPTMTRGAAMHASALSSRLGLGGWPREAEEIIVERDVRLARRANARYHVQHISSAETVEILRRAQHAGVEATGEATPHHLLLTHEICDEYNTQGKVNPPLRDKADVTALREGVATGVITVLATDHAPHCEDEKGLPFEEAPFGFVGLESAVPLYAEALVQTGLISWVRLVALLTVEPARLCGLDAMGLGRLHVGGPADVTVYDPSMRWTLSRETLSGRCVNTPFLGRALVGRARATIVAGTLRWMI